MNIRCFNRNEGLNYLTSGVDYNIDATCQLHLTDMGRLTMLMVVQVFRATFKTKYGVSSNLIAIKSLNDSEKAINEYEKRTNSTFIEITETCVMTPFLYIGDKET